MKLPLSLKSCLCFAAILLAYRLAWGADAGSARVTAARENNIGVALMNQYLVEKALTHFESAHAADPAALTPVVNKGLAQIYLRHTAEAHATLEAATTTAPTSARVWYDVGLAYFEEGNQTVALGHFEQALKLDPSDADTHYYVGAIELALKDYTHATEEFQRAIELSPLHASAQYGLARALLRTGKTAESREHLRRFEEITQSKIGVLFSTNYGEQGHYALALDMLAPAAAAGLMIPVKFVASAGNLGGTTAGAGACILNLNGAKAVVSMGSGNEAVHVFRMLRTGAMQEISARETGLSVSGVGVSCAVGDYDNDGLPDVAIALQDRVEVFHNLGNGRFANTTQALGIRASSGAAGKRPTGLTFVDFDHDGDLDLYVTGAGGSVLWRNNGNSTFTDWTAQTALGGSAETESATVSDLNNDRAVDFVVAGKDASPAIYENQREGEFKRVALYDDPSLGAASAGTRGVLAFDFNKDGWMDLAVTHEGAPGITLWRNLEGKRFERVALPVEGAKQAWGLAAIDVDNDGWIDLAAIVEDERGTRLRVFRNLGAAAGARGFEDVTDALGLSGLDVAGARSLIAADMNGDGAADLVVARGNAVPLVLLNVGGNKNHSLRISLTGLADNKSGLGTKVEVFVDGASQKFEVAGASGYMGQGATEIIAGLGQETKADFVRMLWPTGVPQDELDVSAVKPVAMTELDRRGSSCPVLFAWDGAKYEFVTDVIGAAVVGHWVSPTTRNKNDSDEWVKVDGAKLRARDGRLSLRFGEPMEEINYVDQLRLVAVDHPEGTEVYPDERFLDEPPFASGKAVLASAGRHLPLGAWGDKGEDVLPLLARNDHEFVRDFENLNYAGFAKRHDLTIDVGEWSAERPLKLFLSGFIEYFSATSMYAAWQAGMAPESPTVEAQMPDGAWKKIVDDMGFPAGLPRTIVVDLTGKMPQGSRRIRIRTNLQIYWDQAMVDNAANLTEGMTQTELPLASATLAFRGYPKQIDGKTPGDLTYDYQQISATGPFQWQRGNYTRYGAVGPLLEAKDDRFVVFGSGEDIDAEFSDAALPPLPANWRRDYFFYADGFVKDMDFYEALPFTVSEMPFHGMSTYPYGGGEHYPETEETLKYRLDWNGRFETGERPQLFQFRYATTRSEPISERVGR